MGSLRDLADSNKNVHILLSSSNLSELYVYDTLKAKCNANVDSIFNIDSKSSINEMLELVNLQPFTADKWLFVLDFKKAKSVIKDKKGIFESSTSEFLIKVKDYKEYKEAKELLGNVNDIYLSFIRFYDTEFLLKDYNIPPKLIGFISKSYSSDPEQIFALREELNNGRVIERRKDIIDICGVSAGSLNSYALTLLKDFPKTDKGRKIVCKNRIGVAYELAETYGFSKMRNFLLACVKDILDIKQLYMVGTIYDRIENLPDCYDTKRLSRYKSMLNIIIEIPYSRILNLYLCLKQSGNWYKDIDMVSFLYLYYEKGEK